MTVTYMPPTDAIDLVELVSSNIRAYAGRLRMNQSDLARALGKPQPWVSMKWNGKRPWQLRDLPEIATVLGVSVAQLVTPPPGYAEWVADMNNSPAGGSHQSGSKARSKGLEPPTFWLGVAVFALWVSLPWWWVF